MSGEREHAEVLRGQVAELLAPLGLTLSLEKTRVIGIDDGFDFLGFHIRRMRKRGTMKSYVYTVPARNATAAAAAASVAVTRYRCRGNRIPTPWTPTLTPATSG